MTSGPKYTLLKRSIRFGLLVLSLAYIVYFFVRNKDTLNITFSLDWKTLVLIVILKLISFTLLSWRFQIVMEKCSGVKLPFGPWMKYFILGRFLNLILPQAGNVYRSIQLKSKYGISYTRYISGFSSMVWIDTVMNLILAAVVIVVFDPALQIGQYAAWKLLVLILGGLVLAPVLLAVLFTRIKPRQKQLRWIHSKLSEVLHVTLSNLHDVRFLLKLFGIILLTFVRTIITFYLYFKAFDLSVTIPALAVFYTLFKLFFLIVLTPGNLGVQEIAWGYLSEQMGIGMAQGIIIAGFIRIVNTGMLILLGIAFGGIELLPQLKKYRKKDNPPER